jgi:hypothetical protein
MGPHQSFIYIITDEKMISLHFLNKITVTSIKHSPVLKMSYFSCSAESDAEHHKPTLDIIQDGKRLLIDAWQHLMWNDPRLRWEGVPHSLRLPVVSFICGGNRCARKKPQTCRKPLTNFIT